MLGLYSKQAKKTYAEMCRCADMATTDKALLGNADPLFMSTGIIGVMCFLVTGFFNRADLATDSISQLQKSLVEKVGPQKTAEVIDAINNRYEWSRQAAITFQEETSDLKEILFNLGFFLIKTIPDLPQEQECYAKMYTYLSDFCNNFSDIIST